MCLVRVAIPIATLGDCTQRPLGLVIGRPASLPCFYSCFLRRLFAFAHQAKAVTFPFMMKRTLYILALTTLLLLATIMGKVEFLAYNRDIVFFTLEEMMQVLWHGLPLDMSTVAMA